MTEDHPLRAWRKQNGKTITEVAKDAGCAPSFISDVECGLKQPRLPLALKLSEMAGIPVDKFLRQEVAQ